MADPKLRGIVERDVRELSAAEQAQLPKAALLLCGSILEAMLIDVLNRRPDIASSYMKKHAKWPEDASLPQLIAMAGQSEPLTPEGKSAPLLGPGAAAQAASVTDHRDLVHPHAELRDRLKVDPQKVELMIALVKNVARDLTDADKAGFLAAWAIGSVK